MYDGDMLMPLKTGAVLIADRIRSAEKISELKEILVAEKENLPLKGAADGQTDEYLQQRKDIEESALMPERKADRQGMQNGQKKNGDPPKPAIELRLADHCIRMDRRVRFFFSVALHFT